MKIIMLIISLTLLLTFSSQGKEKLKWPDLKTIKYIKGKAAQEQDIKDGKAVFILTAEGKIIGKPINITIPQYAIHIDEETKEETKVVIIQAEKADGQKYYGALIIEDETFLAGMHHEFKLLGQSIKEEKD